ncbi:major facilitator superfamily domain-containing protein 3 isoform X1 [Pristis pectinata]|uniref:major facilitator superfamily domain-containing protein 3 isoform X1 n=1 Tax=Pristis pectinata TaxID=685728 RepID=UPI00223CA3F2|nr:major facilitator superfamily domain-containing protein 3 isoform X1 [Pristis pectinata]XP_051876323.1 major facilitator superfamily domain-containing protein 3 isoform X1 [Pristis pectinata]XP_051876324.1 major facilitator superfamily domain-containing protein 3 isoform X1 [Pristis pectinata]XP_051876325.1 major facilitator superfamily domain-containing protein 3 isoform X1 [Pristis pectinata]
MTPFKLKLFGLLYFVQGMPYGLQSSLLPIYLRTFGLSFTKISLTKLLYFPWLLKILWAPFVDQYGTKWKWLLCSMFGLFLCCLIMSRLTPDMDFTAMAFILLLMNLFASVQDIAVDGIAVRLLSSEDIGYGNSIQVVAYKMGSLLAGAWLLTVMDYIGWNMLFIIFCMAYAVAMIFSYFTPEPENTSETKNGLPVLNPCKILGEILKVPGTVWNLIYVIIYKLGEQGAVSMFPMFLLEHGFSPAELGFWNGIVAMGFSIFGSCFGGILMPKYKVQVGWGRVKKTEETADAGICFGQSQWSTLHIVDYAHVDEYQSSIKLDSFKTYSSNVLQTTVIMNITIQKNVSSNCRIFAEANQMYKSVDRYNMSQLEIEAVRNIAFITCIGSTTVNNLTLYSLMEVVLVQKILVVERNHFRQKWIIL